MTPLSPQAAADEVLRRRRARARLLDFTTTTYNAYRPNWHHELLCRKLDAFAAGTIKRLLVFMPPQHGKSEAVSRRLPAKLLGDDPALRIISCSYTADLAAAMNRDVQKIMDSEEYKRLYPRTRLGSKNVRTIAGPTPLRNSEMFEVIDPALGQLTGGYYKSAGVGGGITGRPMDVGIIDDPIKGRAMADSPAHREAVWGWYNGDFLSRAHGNTRILVTCTRWHEDDLPGRLLKKQEEDPAADKWEVLCLPAICEIPGLTPGDPRGVGEPLWPAMHPLALLEAKRAASPYDWASLYQQKPRAQGMVEWPDEYFGPGIWFDQWPADLVCKVISLDPSKGKSDKPGDYSAFVVLGVDRSLNLWVDADLDNMRPVETFKVNGGASILEDGLRLFSEHGPKAILIETNGFQELVAQTFLRESLRRSLHLPLYTVNNTQPKAQRIRSLGTYLAQVRIRFRKSRGGRLLVQQLRDFPTGAHDDGPDALEMAEKMANFMLYGRQGDNNVQLLAG